MARELDANLDEYLEAGLILHPTSPYSSLLVVIPKNTGDARITVDYEYLNQISSFTQLPMIETVSYTHLTLPTKA